MYTATSEIPGSKPGLKKKKKNVGRNNRRTQNKAAGTKL